MIFLFSVKDALLCTTFMINFIQGERLREIIFYLVNPDIATEKATGFKKENYSILEKVVEFYCANYKTIVEYKYTPNEGKQYLGDKNNRVCRFCNKDKTQTKFSDNPKNAHAIPQALGNNEIFSYYECIPCNTFFAKYEKHLGDYTNNIRARFMIPGKKGYPNVNDTLVWDPVDKIYHWNIVTRSPDEISKYVDITNKKIKCRDKVSAYIPIKVMKALVKIALTLLPSEYIKSFSRTLQWLMDEDDKISLNAQLIISFTPGKVKKDLNYAKIICRCDSDAKIPYMFCIISLCNVVYQIPLVPDELDAHIVGSDINLYAYPLHFIHFNDFFDGDIKQFVNFNNYKAIVKDMSDKKKRKNEDESMSLSFEKVEKISKEKLKEISNRKKRNNDISLGPS